MKRIILVSCFISLAGLSSFASAELTSSQMINQPLVSNPKFELTIDALLLQPSSSLLDYAVLGYPLPVQTPHWKVSAVSPSYSAGFELAARYYIQNTRNDVHLSWNHLRTSDSDSTQAGPSQFVVVMFQAGPSAGQNLNDPSTHADATAEFDYDVVNLDVGRYIDYYDAQLRLFLGVSAVQIKENLSTTFRDNASTFSVNTTNNSRFTGVGPLLGLDGKCKIPYGFGVIGSAGVSALIGTVNPVTSFTSSSPELAINGITTNNQSISPRNTNQVVPAFAGKVGLDYSHAFYNNAIFTAALGYEYAVYFNSIVAYNPSTVFGNINTGTIALSSLAKSVSNFSVQGPFLNFSFSFA
jgi:hypothetical protein